LRSEKRRVQFFRAWNFERRVFPAIRISTGAFLPHLKQVRFVKKALCHTHKMEYGPLRCSAKSGSYPQKGIAKNFVSLITYPHSGGKRLEKPPFTNPT
jgi:hypothetical protein